METLQLIRHYQENSVGEIQGWHPSTLMRWLLFLIPLIYYLVIRCFYSNLISNKSLLSQISIQQRKQQSRPQSYNFRQSGLFVLIILFIGLYAVINNAWSTKEWVIWAAMLIFAGLMLIFSHLGKQSQNRQQKQRQQKQRQQKNRQYQYRQQYQFWSKYGFAMIAALFSFGCFFMTQWLFAQTRDMNDNTWKHVVRIFHGFNVATTLLNFLTRFYKIVGHYCSWQIAPYTTYPIALSITYLLACIGLTILNIIVYGPFLDVIGFIIGWILCVYFVCLSNAEANSVFR